MNFVSPNHPDITTNAGKSPLNSTSKLEASNLEYNKAFKEAEGLNIINSVSNSN